MSISEYLLRSIKHSSTQSISLNSPQLQTNNRPRPILEINRCVEQKKKENFHAPKRRVCCNWRLYCTVADSSNFVGCLCVCGRGRHGEPRSDGLRGNAAMKTLQFDHSQLLVNCVSHLFTNVTNSLADYWKPTISHSDLVI